MLKKDLVNKIAEKTLLKKVDIELVLEEFLNTTKETLQKDEPVILAHFGKFETVERAEKVCRNPQTGEKIIAPTKRVVKFKPSKNFLGSKF